MTKALLTTGAAALCLNAWCADGTPAKPAESAPAKAAEPTATTPDLETRTFVLKYAKAEEVADSLNRLCEKLKLTEAAVAFPESHSVAVAASSSASNGRVALRIVL